MVRAFALLSLCAFALVCIPSHSVAGPNDRYSTLVIINESPYRIDYSYRWDEGDRWWSNNIKAGGSYVHSWKFGYPGQDSAPFFYVELEGDNSSYKLRSFFAPNEESKHARVYYVNFDDQEKKFKLSGKLYKD